jgi:DNA-binding CsgD family transcriptional regulator
MKRKRKLAGSSHFQPIGATQQSHRPDIGQASPARARAASEVGAAIIHQLNGPLTALLLYVGDLRQNIDQFPAAVGVDESLGQVVERAYRETERVCLLMQRLGESFEAPLQQQSAVAVGRDLIGWWLRAGDGGNPASVGNSPPAVLSPSGVELLTPRERTVLRLVKDGCSNKQGGLQLQISYRTFESHRANVIRKLGAKNTADLVRLSFSEVPPAL